MNKRKWKVAGINFDHMHMGDNLRMAFENPDVEIVGICDEQIERMSSAIANFKISKDRVFTHFKKCMEETKPDIVILCPATADHEKWVKKIAPFEVHIILEKPFASSLTEADAIIKTVNQYGKYFMVNWPLAWYPSHRTAKRILNEGIIGDLQEVHYYGGNKGPLWHVADKIENTIETVNKEKNTSWFYKKKYGGGSLQDYMGYGTTIGTWYQSNRKPIEVTSVVDIKPGLEVDEHSISIAKYAHGLSKFETRWGTYTDPWTHQPQPKCGFILKGTEGTISSYDYESNIIVQSKLNPAGKILPADNFEKTFNDPIQYLIHCIETSTPVEGPFSIETSRIGQQIIETAVQSAIEKRTISLIN